MSLQYDECSRFSSQQIIKWLEPCLNNKTQNDVSLINLQINEFILINESLSVFSLRTINATTVILSNCCRTRYQTVPNRTFFKKLRSTYARTKYRTLKNF
jgi:hypothetical protein